MKFLPFAVLLLAVVPLLSHFDVGPVLGDEGVLAMDGLRISKGQVPHRDFFQFIPPLAAYVQAFFFKLFSPTVFSVRLLGTIYGLTLLALTFLLYRKFIKKPFYLALALSPLVSFGVACWQFGSHHWLVDILQVAAFILVLRAVEKGTSPAALAAGCFLGLATFTMQDQGAYAVIGLLAAALFMKGKERRGVATAALSAVAVFALLSMVLASSTGYEPLVKSWVSFPLDNYARVGGNRTTFSQLAGEFLESWDARLIAAHPLHRSAEAFCVSFVFLSPVLSVVSLVFLFARRARPKGELLLLSVFSLVFIMGALHRLSLTNLVWAYLCQLPFFMALDASAEMRGRPARIISFSASVSLFIILMGFGLFQNIFLATPGNFVKVETKAGSYRFTDIREARTFREINDEIGRRVPESAGMFCVGFIPLINFTSGRNNPTPFNFIQPGGYYSKEQVLDFFRAIRSGGTEWGVSERGTCDERLGKSLLPGYEAVFVNEDFVLWNSTERREGAR